MTNWEGELSYMKENVTIKILFVTSIHGSGRKQGTLSRVIGESLMQGGFSNSGRC